MKLDVLLKEHKRFIIWVVVLVLIVAVISGIRELREKRMGHFNKGERSNYSRNFGGEGGRYNRYSKESCGISECSNKKESNFVATKKTDNLTNKIAIPLNIISEADASKIAINSNSGAKVTQASIESKNGVVAYSFVLDNKKEVGVDAVNGKIIADNKTEQVKTEKQIINK